MKLITIQYPDATDLSAFAVGAQKITVTDGTNSLLEGEVLAKTEMKEPDAVLVPHTHTISGVSAPALVTGISGPAAPETGSHYE